jgi:dTDP-4-dehydrorhamnose 3,5-epimerase
MANIMIDGIMFKELTTYVDERGFFREIIRVSDDLFAEGFGQWSHSLMFDGVIKAWHMHHLQVDWWYVVTGVLRVGLCDLRPKSPTYRQTMDFLMGDLQPAQVLTQVLQSIT